jgi:RNA polymerase sigma factor (sigma-70 family)
MSTETGPGMDTEARNRLVMENEGLARMVVMKFMPIIRERGLEFEDYLQVATQKMIEIIGGYDESNGAALSTYLCEPMERSVRIAVNQDSSVGSYKIWMDCPGNDKSPTCIKARSHIGRRSDANEHPIQDAGTDVVDEASSREYAAAVRRAVSKLTPVRRRVIEAWLDADCSYSNNNLHEQLGMTKQGVSYHRIAAMKELEYLLSPIKADFTEE